MTQAVWLFDGVCVLCSGAVAYLLRHERDHTIQIVALQSATGRALAVEGVDKALEGLSVEETAIVQGQLDAEYLKDNINKEIGRLPKEPVKKGDTWELTQETRIGGGQTMTFKTKYTYAGPTEKNGQMLEKIEVLVTGVEYALDGLLAGQLKLEKSELKIANSKGEILYDRVAQPYGHWILLALFVSGALGYVLTPILNGVRVVLHAIAL